MLISTFILICELFNSLDRCRMAAMLSKFRIDYSDVIVITDITKKPEQSTRDYFNGLTKNFVETETNTGKYGFLCNCFKQFISFVDELIEPYFLKIDCATTLQIRVVTLF